MRIIKYFIVILTTLFLFFVVFFNTANVHAEDIDVKDKFVKYVSSGYDDYWVNMQDTFDDMITRYANKNGNQQLLNNLISLRSQVNSFDYVAIPCTNVPEYLGVGYNNNEDLRGYIILVYNTCNFNSFVSSSSDFSYGTINDFYGGYYDNVSYFDNSFSFNAILVPSNRVLGVWNYNNNYGQKLSNISNEYVPLSVYNYYHSILYDYLDRSNTSGATQITSAIQSQTNTIKEESQKQQNAVATATQKQTNELLDTNNTGNETMSVNDTTTDTSTDLSSFYTSINSAFTDNNVQTIKEFTFTLPNGDNFTIQLSASTILNFLNSFPVLKAFYQSIFWVIFGGYVIFDFKKIINKMKEGNIDDVVGSSSPVDSVVNMSLK